MIVMDVKIDNFYAFKNFHINMSYPKKIVNSYIPNEYLEEFPNFRYKKVNILMGANATGKTSFGKMLMNIFNFAKRRTTSGLLEAIADTEREASFAIDFIVDPKKMYRLECSFAPHPVDEAEEDYIDAYVKSVNLTQKDNYETCAKRLDGIRRPEVYNYISELEKIQGLHWYFEYPADSSDTVLDLPKNSKIFDSILEHMLKALDPSILSVTKSKDSDEAYVIRMPDRSAIIQSGEKLSTELLSSGTKAGIAVACFIDTMIECKNTFFYCDEKFSYIHSDLEKAVLSLLINTIKTDDQFFFTTHNTEILDLPLPKHTFTFFKKNASDAEMPIKCISASALLQRSTDSIKHAVENDLFSTAPALDLIYEMEELI